MTARLVILSLCLVVLGGCSLSSKLCGEAGQGCCEKNRCGENLLCGGDQVCHPCGGEGEGCCAEQACRGSLTCRENACTAPPATCDGGCTTGARRCSLNGALEACAPTSGCGEWQQLLPSCPAGQSCIADGGSAACIERCPNACTVGAFFCSVTGPKKCVQASAAVCPTLVAANANEAPPCPAGACSPDDGFCWESPVPVGANLKAIAAWGDDSYFLLDMHGNVISNLLGAFSYEIRADPTRQLRALTLCAPSQGLVVGDKGEVRYRRGGVWEVETLPNGETPNLQAVQCGGLSRAVAAGQGGNIYVRRDTGGWVKAPSPTTRFLRGVSYGFSWGDAFAVGDNGTVVHCRPVDQPASLTCTLELDGGLGTQPLSAVFTENLDSRTLAVGPGGTLLERPLRQSSSWSRVDAGTSVALAGVVGDRSRDWIFGEDGVLLDRAAAGFKPMVFTQRALSGMSLLIDTVSGDAKAGFIVGEGGGIWFNDTKATGQVGVNNWKAVGGAGPITANLTAVHGKDVAEVYAVGDEGSVFRRADETWREEAKGLTTADLHSVFVVSPGEVYAAGTGGTLLARRNGTWSVEGQGVTTASLNSIFSDGQTVFVVGSDGTWLEKPVGAAGNQWAKVNHGKTSKALLAVTGQVPTAGGSALEVTAVGDECTVLFKRGTAFVLEAAPQCAESLFGASETSTGELLVVGDSLYVARRSIAGGTLAKETVPGDMHALFSVGRAGSEVWAAGEFGSVYQRSGGVWRQRAVGLTHRTLFGVGGTSDGALFIVGNGGTVWKRQ